MIQSELDLADHELLSIEKKNIKKRPGSEILEKAGSSVFEEVVQYFTPCKTIILCGPGNKGGVGFVLARLLKNINWNVIVAVHHSNNKYSRPNQKNIDLWKGRIIDFAEVKFQNYDLIIDAIIGMGINGKIKGVYSDIIKKANKSKLPIVSIDIPSGIDAINLVKVGQVIKADMTIAFGADAMCYGSNDLCSYMGKIISKDLK